MLTSDRIKKKQHEINMLNKNAARNNKMTTVVFGTKTGPGLYIGKGGGGNVVVCKTGWVGEGAVLHEQHSIVITGNVNAMRVTLNS